MKINKKEVRKNFRSKYGRSLPAGRMQLSDHGAERKSIQIFARGKLVADVDVSGLW